MASNLTVLNLVVSGGMHGLPDVNKRAARQVTIATLAPGKGSRFRRKDWPNSL